MPTLIVATVRPWEMTCSRRCERLTFRRTGTRTKRTPRAGIQPTSPLGISLAITPSQSPRRCTTGSTRCEPNSVFGPSRATTAPPGARRSATRETTRAPMSSSDGSGVRTGWCATRTGSGVSTGCGRSASSPTSPGRCAGLLHHLPDLAPGVAHVQAREHLVGELQVVLAEVGAVVEDRDGALGRLGVGDRRADRRIEQALAEVLLELHVGLARVDRPHVGDVEHHAEPVEVRVEAVAGQLEHLERLLH